MENRKFKVEDDFEPANGVLAVRRPEGMPRYNMAELMDYCKMFNIKPMDLTREQKKRFEIN